MKDIFVTEKVETPKNRLPKEMWVSMTLQTTPSWKFHFFNTLGTYCVPGTMEISGNTVAEKIKYYSRLHETYGLVRRADIYEMIPQIKKNYI